jgi:molybdopterin-guanine dinucleotide biosynthesis protein MobB
MPALLSIVGRKGSAKSEVLEGLIRILTARGHRIGVIKRLARDDFEIDEPGKDSYRYRKGGAETVVLAGRKRLAVFSNLEEELPLENLVGLFGGFDLVLLEGFFQGGLAKVEIHRREAGNLLLQDKENNVVALCTDESQAVEVPQFSFERLEELASFIEERLLSARAGVSG